jgi:hypothetical protein
MRVARAVWIAVTCAGCSAGAGDASRKEPPAAAPAEPAAEEPVATPAAAAPNAPPDRDEDPCSGLFDPPAGATKLCDEHVMGQGAEIHWSSWAVTTTRWDTFMAYQRPASGCGASTVSKPPLLAVSKDDIRLSIHDVSETSYPTCTTRPGPEANTVIVISAQQKR